MGCFDFTYADNGMNTRGGKGFLYLSNCFAKAARLQNPLHDFFACGLYGFSDPAAIRKMAILTQRRLLGRL